MTSVTDVRSTSAGVVCAQVMPPGKCYYNTL